MAEKFPLDAAQIVALFMESVFYGIYLVTFFDCIRVLLWLDGGFKPKDIINKKMLIAALLMFVFGSLDLAFGLRHNIVAFIDFEGDPIEQFTNTSYWVNVMKMVCFVAQTFVGDAILLYRCWIIYNRNWMVLTFPTLLWLAGTVCGSMTIYVEATLTDNEELLNDNRLVPFITSMLSLTLAMNALTTSLIVHRIWKIQRSLKHRSNVGTKSPVDSVMRVLVESGLFYTVSILVLFGLYMASHNGILGVSNSVVQIIGITFNLIITSVDRGNATQPMSHTFRSHSGSNSVPLHMINIQTTISRFPADAEVAKSDTSEIDVRPEGKREWQAT